MANQRAAKPLASKAVFVNCPFDEECKPIFRAMIFAVISSGYNPRCALDSTDGAEIRVSKIATMIGKCDYGIHDLSRIEVDAGGVAASEFFGLTLLQAREIIREVATVTARWRDTAKVTGARPAEIDRMASAFEHDDLKRALAL